MLIWKSGRNVVFRGQSGRWKGGLGLEIAVKVFGVFFAFPKKRGQKKGAIALGLFAKRAGAFWEKPLAFGKYPWPFYEKGETRDGTSRYSVHFSSRPRRKTNQKEGGSERGKNSPPLRRLKQLPPRLLREQPPTLCKYPGPFAKREGRGMESRYFIHFSSLPRRKTNQKEGGCFPARGEQKDRVLSSRRTLTGGRDGLRRIISLWSCI